MEKQIYVYMASFYQIGPSISYNDSLMPRDSKNVSYSLYGTLIGEEKRVYVSINDRDEFEANNEIIYLSDFDPYKKYYDLRKEYIEYTELCGLDNTKNSRTR